MKLKKQLFRHGDIFAIPLSTGQFLMGRVVFNVSKQYGKAGVLYAENNYLRFFSTSILIEVYRDLLDEPALPALEVLIPGVFTSTTLLDSGVWSIIGNQPVDPTQVDFPEVFVSWESATVFEKGELFIPTPLNWTEYEALPFRASIKSPYTIGSMGLNYLGLRHLIEEKFLYPQYLEKSDLRYQPQLRVELYNQMKQDPNQSYYQMALKYGLDLARLY